MSVTDGPVCSTDEQYGDSVNSSYNWYLTTKGDTIRICTDRTISGPSASGMKGQICYDANYIYICVATDTWKRAAISNLLWT